MKMLLRWILSWVFRIKPSPKGFYVESVEKERDYLHRQLMEAKRLANIYATLIDSEDNRRLFLFKIESL